MMAVRLLGIMAAGILLLNLPTARGQVSWSTSAGDWSVASNWGGVVPTLSDRAYIANGGTATITQPGEMCNSLVLGTYATDGTVQMTSGGLNVPNLNLGIYANSYGTFLLSGGTVSTMSLVVANGGDGTFMMSGGSLGVNSLNIDGNGVFFQSGGTCSVYSLAVGNSNPTGPGVYSLAGTATLNATYDVTVGQSSVAGRLELFNSGLTTPTLTLGTNATLAIGFDFSMASLASGALFHGSTLTGLNLSTLEVTNGATAVQSDGVARTVGNLTIGSSAGAGALQLTGGTLATSYLSCGANGSLQLGGGTLQINGGLQAQGTIEGFGGGGSSIVARSSIVDLSQMTAVNLATTSLAADANSLVIVLPKVDPASTFRSYGNLGMTHTAGTTLVVPAGQGFSGVGTLVDPIDCQGSITVSNSAGSLNLTGGLSLSGSGTINLGNGALTTNDSASSLSGGQLLAANHYVGSSGAGSFTQSGGTNTIANMLTLGSVASGYGTYALSGSAVLAVGSVQVDNGKFIQSGGTNNVTQGSCSVGCQAGSTGTYTLSGSGILSPGLLIVGGGGVGSFVQTGGTCSVGGYGEFVLGGYPSSSGSYALSNNALLKATYEYVSWGSLGSASFKQSGGTNSASLLQIAQAGQYQLAAGTLLINGGLRNQGVFDGAGGPGMVVASANSVVDLSQGSMINTGSMSLAIGANSLLIVPPGFDPATAFASYSNAGMVHTAGTPLVVPAGHGFAGAGTIGDPVICQGTIRCYLPDSPELNLQGGLNMSGSANINLGWGGNLITNDAFSSMSGGTLQGNHYIGYSGTGSFTQTGGVNACSSILLGFLSGDQGVYTLSGSGVISAYDIEIGCGGPGSFFQTGGTTTATNDVTLGSLASTANLRPSGSYNLSGGLLSANIFINGGNFNQSAGTVTTRNLNLAVPSGSGGGYSLSGNGLLTAQQIYLDSGFFNQSAGTVTTSGLGSSNSNGSGTYSLSGSGIFNANSVSTSGFVQDGGTATINSQLSGAYQLNGGLLVLSGSALNNGPTTTFTFSGGTLASGGKLSFAMPITLVAGAPLINVNGFAITLSGAVSGPGSLTKVGSGTLTLATSNGYTGTTMIDGGTLSLANSATLAGGGNIAFGGGALQYTASNNIDYSNRIAGSTGPISIDTNGVNVTFAAGLDGSNSGGLTKIGSGSLTLAGSNGYTGATLIRSGTLAMRNSLALQNSTLDTSGGGPLSFGPMTAATFGGLTGTGALTLANTASAAVALSVGNNNANGSFSGMLKGPGSLTKIGSGTLTLTGNNTYTGGTSVNSGALQALSTASLPGYATAGRITVSNGGTLVVSAGGNGWSSINIASLLNSNGGRFANGSVIGIDTTAGNFSYGSSIAGGMGLEKLGGNSLVLAGSNAYAGGTFVTAGTLEVINPAALPDGTSLTIGAGAASMFGGAVATTPAADAAAIVPEPSTCALLTAGIIGLLGHVWRRRKHTA